MTFHSMQIAIRDERLRGAVLARWLRRLVAAARRRLQRNRELYRRYNMFRREHGLSPIDPDDWTTLRYDRTR